MMSGSKEDTKREEIVSKTHPSKPSVILSLLNHLKVGDGIGLNEIIQRSLERIQAVENNAFRHIDLDTDANHALGIAGQSSSTANTKPVGAGIADRGPYTNVQDGSSENHRTTNQSIRRVSVPETQYAGTFPPPQGEARHLDDGSIDEKPITSEGNLPDTVQTFQSGLYGTEAVAPFSQGLSKYFATVGSTREKRLVAISAWIITIVVLFVCLVLVTKDFINSNKEGTISLSHVLEDSLDIPDTYICAQEVSFPNFAQLPTPAFPGTPYFWVSSVKVPGIASPTKYYPETLAHPNVELVNVDKFGKPCNASGLTYADAESFWNSEKASPLCFNCILVKSRPSISILRSELARRSDLALEDAAVASSFAIEVSQNSILQSCKASRGGLQLYTLHGLRDLIIKHLDGLQSRGIVDFGSEKPRSREELERFYIPQKRDLDLFIYKDYLCEDVADFLCNTYLFSGYFYPVPPTQQIAFLFNSKTRRWDRKPGSKGPYFPPKYEDWFKHPQLKSDGSVVPYQALVGLSKFENPTFLLTNSSQDLALRSTRSSNVVKLLVNGSKASGDPLKQISASAHRGLHSIFFVKETRQGRVSYVATNEAVPLNEVDRSGGRSRFFIHLTCKDFLTRSISEQTTVQVSSFLADFFGLIELFLDLSVYTLIISPLTVLRRRNLVRDNLRRQVAASSVSPI